MRIEEVNIINECINEDDFMGFDDFIAQYNVKNLTNLDARYIWAAIHLLSLHALELVPYIDDEISFFDEFVYNNKSYMIYDQATNDDYLSELMDECRYAIRNNLLEYPDIEDYVDVDTYFENKIYNNFIGEYLNEETNEQYYLREV